MSKLWKSLGQVLAAAAATSLVAAPMPATGQARPVGVNAAVRNQVQIRDAGTSRVHPALLRARVMLNDEVRTGRASQLQILLLDRSTFTVGANARVAVDRFAFDPAANTRATGISVARGAFRFMSGRALGSPTGRASVRTPVASIGIRGTIFEGVVGPDAAAIAAREPALAALHLVVDPKVATLVILRGPGPGTQGDAHLGAIDVTAGESTVTLDRPGEAVFVPHSGAAPIRFTIDAPVLFAMQQLLRTVPPGDAAGAAEALAAAERDDGLPPSASAPAGSNGPDDGTGPGHRRRGIPGLAFAAIPAVILGILAATSGGQDLPASP
jgi:hypothetical protein